MITAQDILAKLTDVFNKSPDSNIGKLCGIMATQLQKLQETNERIRQWRDIDLAQGTTLDRIGENVVQPRGAARDEVYRILIKSKIARNMSTGDINTIIRVLAIALDAEYSEIKIEELFNDPVAPEPATIKVIELPLAKLNHTGMSPAQFAKIVKRTVAAGVSVGVIELAGTFEFGSVPGEIDNNAGFSDDGTIGGYFGSAISPDDVPDLPV